jgi:predicted naringenin-chalcone synthase
VTCTGFYAPGIDIMLMEKLNLPATTQRLQIGFMGCHAAINGLRAAQAIVESDARAIVLLCAVELCSLHFYYGWDVEKVKANALFADGAAALVATAHREHTGESTRVIATGSCLLPDSKDDMSWRIGDHGFEMTLSKGVIDTIELHLRPWLVEWLAALGFGLEDIRSWAIHPGGPRIVDTAGAALGLPETALQDSREILAEHGNMSSPTVLFILERLRQRNASFPCIALGFGPGIIAEAALLL